MTRIFRMSNRRRSTFSSKPVNSCSPEKLAGETGLDFKGDVLHIRRSYKRGCLQCLKKKDVEFMVIIKADHLFVYNKTKLYAPRYAVLLAGLEAKVDGSVVSLVNQSLEEEYAFTFEEPKAALAFSSSCSRAIGKADLDRIKKRLNHPRPLTKRASTLFAMELGKRAEQRQPEKPDSFYTAEKLSGAGGAGIVSDGMFNSSNVTMFN
ncbi:hypothetical protein TrRE_jg7614 [Triparma retinervis]|uniref:Uncharacterized protein n=1 Tax=Triparma retinervis TaxID=2557542 RepID=A0A9W6ZPK0_9STRA|nr:hypothetical protein TrRE_jg7614 [Triparma retinervis]